MFGLAICLESRLVVDGIVELVMLVWMETNAEFCIIIIPLKSIGLLVSLLHDIKYVKVFD